MNEALVGVLTDLERESAQLDRRVGGLDAASWATITTAERRTVALQIAHWLTILPALAGLPGTNQQRKAA